MIGLDTGHLVYNYGTKLQAYAMQVLLEQSGEPVEIIQWHNKDLKIFNGISDKVRLIKKIRKTYGFKFKYWIKAYNRYKVIDSFNKKYHIHKFYGSLDDMKKQMDIYDKVFCGSDQAWLPDNVVRHAYTLEYCCDKVFKAAYAPSFGVDYVEEKYRDKYLKFLSRFDSISVREISGQKIIEEILGKEVPVVLDPTLLVSKDKWDELKKESKIKIPCKEKYIFCYLLGDNREHRNEIKRLKEKYGYKIINLQHFYKYCEADENFADYNLYKVSPQDFINLIANSELVCTDSFHCTVFSMQYHKDFIVFERFKSNDKASTNTRLYSLLRQLNMENKIFDGENKEMDKINYGVVDSKLDMLRKKSREYMNQALGGVKNV